VWCSNFIGINIRTPHIVTQTFSQKSLGLIQKGMFRFAYIHRALRARNIFATAKKIREGYQEEPGTERKP